MARKVTIAQIAKKAGVSPTTVSFVLNGQEMGISGDTVRSVLAIAAESGYKRKSASRTGWTRAAYLVENLSHFSFNTTFFSGVYSHLQRLAPNHKIEPFILEFKAAGKDAELDLNEIYNSMGIDVFFTSDTAIAKFLKKHKKKVILIQGGGTLKGVTCIYCDDYKAGKLAADLAFRKGHRVAGTLFPDSCSDHARFQGFADEFLRLGGKILPKYQIQLRFDHEKAVQEIAKFANKGDLPTFFYCFADNVMFPMIRGLALAGKTVPDDVSLIGADNLYWGKLTYPAFTTVDLCEELFAEKLAEGIQYEKNGGEPYELAVPVLLIERETVKDLI